MALINRSAGDSRILGIEVGHVTAGRLDPDALARELIEGRYDLCRLKIRSEESRDFGVSALEKAGFPYFYGGGILRYRFDYRERPYRALYPVPPGLAFQPVTTAEEEATLERMVRRSFHADPIGYFKTPYLSALFDEDAELDCLVEYYLRGDDSGRTKLLVTCEGEVVGFIVMTVRAGVLHRDLLGIAPRYRSRGFFNPMRDYIHLHASGLGIEEEEGARIDNLHSQNVFEDDGLRHFCNEVVFHVTPFLSHSEIEPGACETRFDDAPAAVDRIVGKSLELRDLRCTRRSWRVAPDWAPSDAEPVSLVVRVPIRTPDLVLTVAELVGKERGAGTLLYGEYRRMPARPTGVRGTGS